MTGIKEDSAFYAEYCELTEKLRQKIKQLRQEKAYTQEQMEAFELSLRQFQRIEHGETTNITLSNLFRIAKAFGITPKELLDID